MKIAQTARYISGLFLVAANIAYGAPSAPGTPTIELLEEIPIVQPKAAEPTQQIVEAETPESIVSTQIEQSAHVGNNSGGWSLNNTSIGYKNGRMAVPFVMRGTRIDSLRIYHIYRTTSYGGGNGGTLTYSIYADVNGKPGGEALAVTDEIIAATEINAPVGWSSKSAATSAHPGALWSPSGESGTGLAKFRKIPFKSQVYLKQGGHYWYVVTNTSSKPDTNYVSINNVIVNDVAYAKDPWYTHPAHTVHIDRDGNGNWTDKGDIPIYEFYGDVTFGRVWMEEPSTNSNKGYQLTKGSDLAREVFTLKSTDTFSAVSLFGGRDSGSGSVTFNLKDSGGNIIESGEFNDFPNLPSGTNGDQLRRAMEWRTVKFDNPVTLSAGETYTLEFAASSDHHISSFRDGSKSGYFEGNSNGLSGFAEGTMQISTNNGQSWGMPSQWGNKKDYMDIETYLTRQ